MLSLAAFHLRNFYGSALTYLQSATPAQPTPHSPDTPLREPSDALGLSRPAPVLQQRCKILERTLKDTRKILRAREAEVEKVRKERDRERKHSERRRSDSVPQVQSTHKSDAAHPRRSSADIRPGASHTNGRSATLGKSQAPLPATAGSPRSPPPGASAVSPKHNSLGAAEDRARVRSTEAYLTRTDSWSGAQVLQAVQDINSEILQFAASATEVCTFALTPETRARSAQAMHDTTSRLGPKFARILSNRDHSQDPLLVQWALQGSIALCIARALTAFCLGFPTDADSILSQIYKRMSLAGTFSLLFRHASHADIRTRTSTDLIQMACSHSQEHSCRISNSGRIRSPEACRSYYPLVSRRLRHLRLYFHSWHIFSFPTFIFPSKLPYSIRPTIDGITRLLICIHHLNR